MLKTIKEENVLNVLFVLQDFLPQWRIQTFR